MNQAISDNTSIEFAVGFYGGLGVGKSIEISFQPGKNMIEPEGINEAFIPELIKKA